MMRGVMSFDESRMYDPPSRGRFRRRSSSYGGRDGATRGPHICFCETNPFQFRASVDVSGQLTAGYVICSEVCKWVRSQKTNPFEGVCGVVFIEQWFRFGSKCCPGGHQGK